VTGVRDDSLFFTEDHLAFRDQLRRFVKAEIEPHVGKWDRDGLIPIELYRKASEIGLLQINFPETCGGVPADRLFSIIAQEELSYASGGVNANLQSHTLALPPIVHHGSDALKARVVPAVLSGERTASLAVTEPGGGSDVANIRTTARRDGDHYVVNGEKTFITGAMRADFITTVVRTGGAGRHGISVLVIDGNTPGLQKTLLSKMGWRCSDTATLHFDDCRVPAANLVGRENEGFSVAMANFNDERLGLAASAYGTARAAYDEALAYARQRETFGRSIVQHQVIRHKLVDMAQMLAATRALLEITALRIDRGVNAVADLCLLKNQATQTLAHCATEAVQIFGGAGFLEGAKVERIYREVKVMAIGGGTEEIMKELAARQMGY